MVVVARSKLHMTDEEIEAFLATERVLRLATVDDDGWPHVVPLWFVWLAGRFYVNNLERSKRTRLLRAGAKSALTVDAGDTYDELRGLSCPVTVEFLDPDDTLPAREAFGRKYLGSDDPMPLMRSHTWIALTPADDIASWDFRKLAT